MGSIISRRMDVIRPSASMAVREIAERLRREGREIYDFTIGEPDLPTPAHIAAAGMKAIETGQTRYTATTGIAELKQAIRARLALDTGQHYGADEVVAGSGAKQILFAALQASLDEGDEVLIPAPYWVSYPDMVAVNGGSPRILACPESQGFKLTPAQLEAAISPRTKWLVLNSPNNPSGAIYTSAELQALGGVLLRHSQVWVLSDEIYQTFAYDAEAVSLVQAVPALRDRCLLVNGVSKAYAMTGWRVGYGAGPAVLVGAIATLLSQSTTCPSSISQIAATAALAGDQGCVTEMAAIYRARRDLLCQGLSVLPGLTVMVPDGAFYCFVGVRGLIGKVTKEGRRLETDFDIAEFLLAQAGVATVAGSAYGLGPYLRFSFATSEQIIQQGLAALAAAIAQLN